jgi:hypothetical protein
MKASGAFETLSFNNFFDLVNCKAYATYEYQAHIPDSIDFAVYFNENVLRAEKTGSILFMHVMKRYTKVKGNQ